MTLAPPVAGERRVRPRRLSPGWWIAAILALIPALIPPISLAWEVLSEGSDVILPFGRLAELFANTLILTVAVTVTALAIGTTTAWLTMRTNIRFRRGWMILAALPLVIPSYVAALAIIGATGRAGLISEMVGFTVPTPYGFVGAWLALGVFLAPMAHLIIVPGLSLIDPATEEAAVGLGSSRTRSFFNITLPQLRPALVSAGLMVGLYTISDFGAVSLLRYDTFTRAIFTLYQGQIDRAPAQTLSAILMALALAILIAERRTRGRARYHTARPARRRLRINLSGRGKAGALTFLSSFALVSLVLPVSVLLFWVVRGTRAGQVLPGVWDEAGRTLSISITAAIVTGVAAIPIAMVTARRLSKPSSLIESTAWGTYALPHITVGVAMVGFALTSARPLYQTILLLVITYVAMFLAQAMSTTQDAIRRLNPNLEDASRGLGRGQAATLIRITIPMISPGLLAGAALVFIGVVKELPATLLLRPNGFETLAVRIWSATGEGFLTRASFAALILVAVSIIPIFMVTTRDLGN
jgi:iron(III) transport system permease protein